MGRLASQFGRSYANYCYVFRRFKLDSNKLEPFEIGALLLAILAFPGADEEAMLRNAAEALCANELRTTIEADPARAQLWSMSYPAYAAISERESRRRLRTLERRLRDRMIAARMSMGFFFEGISEQKAKLPERMARLSLNQLSELVLSESGESDPENVERRAWRQSLPVIHLAAAMQIAARLWDLEKDGFGYKLDNAELHAAVIQLTTLHEAIVLSNEHFGKRRDQIIRIRS